MIHVQRSIASAVSFTSDVVQLLQQLAHLPEIFQPDDVFFLNLPIVFSLCSLLPLTCLDRFVSNPPVPPRCATRINYPAAR